MEMVEKVTINIIFQLRKYDLMIDGRNFFDQPIKYNLKTYDNIRKTATGQGDDCTTGYLLDCPYFKKIL